MGFFARRKLKKRIAESADVVQFLEDLQDGKAEAATITAKVISTDGCVIGDPEKTALENEIAFLKSL